MKAIDIYCHRQIKKRGTFQYKYQEHDYGCGWKSSINEPSQIPSHCPDCNCNSLTIEKDHGAHLLLVKRCMDKSWSPGWGQSLLHFLINAGHLKPYLEWRSGLTDFETLFNKVRPPAWLNDDQLNNAYLISVGLPFPDPLLQQRYIADNLFLKDLCSQWRDYCRKTSYVNA
jgi:hypothetical protein